MIYFHSVANSKQQLFSEKNKDQTQSDSRLLPTVIHCWPCSRVLDQAYQMKAHFETLIEARALSRYPLISGGLKLDSNL